jgi:hypothetical protein
MAKAFSLLLLAVTLGLGACKTRTLAGGTEYEELIRRAEHEVRLAVHSGFVWSGTETLLEESKAARAAGDLDKAVRLARTAIDEAVQAQLQARAAAKTKPDFTYRR